MALASGSLCDLFLFGTLRDSELLSLVTGQPASTLRLAEATAEGRAILRVRGNSYPVLGRREGAVATGLLLMSVGSEVLERLCFFEEVFGYALSDIRVRVGNEAQKAKVFLPEHPEQPSDGAWDLMLWQQDERELMLHIAAEIMSLFEQRTAANTPVSLPRIRERVESRMRAKIDNNQNVIRHSFSNSDVRVASLGRPYSKFMAVEDYDLTHRTFDGGWTKPLSRTAFMSADAVTVLPYDPVLDKVVLVEQFRIGAYARGDRQPWLLEVVAGRCDSGQTPEEVARREAVEEAGLELGKLELIARYYPSPGAYSEFIYAYVGCTDLRGYQESTHGLNEEGEDIATHLLDADQLLPLVASGEANNSPLTISILWLAINRERLQKEWTGA